MTANEARAIQGERHKRDVERELNARLQVQSAYDAEYKAAATAMKMVIDGLEAEIFETCQYPSLRSVTKWINCSRAEIEYVKDYFTSNGFRARRNWSHITDHNCIFINWGDI